jgi:hypothetical protein
MISVGSLKFLAWVFFVCFSALPPILGGAAIADGVGDATTARVLRYVALAFGLVMAWAGALLLISLVIRAVEEDEIHAHLPCQHDHNEDDEQAES